MSYEKSPEREAWELESIKASVALTGNKAKTESDKNKAWSEERAEFMAAAREVAEIGTLAPVQVLGHLRSLESTTSIATIACAARGNVVRTSYYLDILEKINRLTTQYAAAVGREEMNEIFMLMEDEEEKRRTDELYGIEPK